MTQIKAIETQYAGCRFRSRLEARWAVFFEEAGLVWEYEPEGYNLGGGIYYLPDFWLPILEDSHPHFPNAGYFIEIKPTNPDYNEIEKAVRLSVATKHTVKFFCGVPGKHKTLIAHNKSGVLMRPDESLYDSFFSCISIVSQCLKDSVDYDMVRHAIIKATSARFEFGECG